MEWPLSALEAVIRKVVWELFEPRFERLDRALLRLERQVLGRECGLTPAPLNPALNPQTYSCPAGVSVGAAVYLAGAGAVGLADASDPAQMPAIGFIARMLNATTCEIQDAGELGGYAGLVPGKRYWLDPAVPGGINLSNVSHPAVEQQAGFAKTDSVLKIQLGVVPVDQL